MCFTTGLGIARCPDRCRDGGVCECRWLGVTVVRATYGGFFLCLGIGCFVAQSPSAFPVVHAAWCTAAAARVLSLAIDGSRSWQNVVGILFEASVGAAMLAARV